MIATSPSSHPQVERRLTALESGQLQLDAPAPNGTSLRFPMKAR